ncbi:hypothetical protein F25303_11844 [Fusarium sp. NRRL 25303]|nr:hypothetical protein F25303_11844 [Fusarium sp. NRRL 25303]
MPELHKSRLTGGNYTKNSRKPRILQKIMEKQTFVWLAIKAALPPALKLSSFIIIQHQHQQRYSFLLYTLIKYKAVSSQVLEEQAFRASSRLQARNRRHIGLDQMCQCHFGSQIIRNDRIYHPTIDTNNTQRNIMMYESKIEGIDRMRFRFCIVDEAHNAKRVTGAVNNLPHQFSWDSRICVTDPRSPNQHPTWWVASHLVYPHKPRSDANIKHMMGLKLMLTLSTYQECDERVTHRCPNIITLTSVKRYEKRERHETLVTSS